MKPKRKKYSIAEARQSLPRLVREAEGGDVLELTRRGEPVAIVLSLSAYERLARVRPFRDTYRDWRARHAVGELGIDPEDFLRGVRDPSPGRDFEL